MNEQYLQNNSNTRWRDSPVEPRRHDHPASNRYSGCFQTPESTGKPPGIRKAAASCKLTDMRSGGGESTILGLHVWILSGLHEPRSSIATLKFFDINTHAHVVEHDNIAEFESTPDHYNRVRHRNF